MKHYRLLTILILTLSLLLAPKISCLAIQYDYTPLETLSEEADKSNYIRLSLNESYRVNPGDTLWGLSRQFLGSGARYEEIIQANQDSIRNGYLLIPGDVLLFPQNLYIPKDKYDRGGLVSEGGFHIASPDMVEQNLFLTNQLNEGDIFGSAITIYSLPVTNQMGENALTASEQDWEAFREEVIGCSETCDGRVSNLKFEKYMVENGCDLCGYSFDFDTGESVMEYVVFYRLGKRNMAEVIGKREREPGEGQDTRLIDVARYIAASFEDFGGRIGMGYTKMADNVGAYDWNYPELHNVFTSAMENYAVYAERPDENFPNDHEIIWKEPMFEQAVRNMLTELWHLDEEEKAAFLDRPVMASDMAVISDIDCTLYKPGNRQADNDPLAAGGPVLILTGNGHEETIYPGKGIAFSYEDLGHFTEAKELRMWGCELTDYSFIANMIHLKALSLGAGATVEDIEFLSSLKELRMLQLVGPYSYQEGAPAGFLKISDVSVLANCQELRYLYLCTPLVTDFSFLKSCPEICTMNLSGEWKGEEQVIPDLELLPKARFLDFYEKNYRFEP